MMSRAVYKAKFKWKREELSYIAGLSAGAMEHLIEELPDGEGAWIKPKQELEALGVMLDRRGNTCISIDHRLTKAGRTYGSISRLLKDGRANIKYLIDAWNKGPVSSAVYGGEEGGI